MYAISLAKSALESYERESMYGEHDVGNIGEKSTYDSGSNSIFESPVRERLQIFLESSDLYDPLQVLELIENSELWLEKVLLPSLFSCFLAINLYGLTAYRAWP